MSADAPRTDAPHAAGTLADVSDVVCRMGAMMLASGTASYRVKLAMGRVAAALGVDQLETQVTLTEIVATMRRGDTWRTRVVEVPTPLVDADRIGELMRLSLRAGAAPTAAALARRLDAVARKPHLHPAWALHVAAGLACAAFAFLNGGGWPECVVAAVAAALGKAAQLRLRRWPVNHLVVVAASAAVACAVAAGLARATAVLLPGHEVHQVATVAATLFLVPGFPLLTAALDLARSDFASGLSRLIFAALVTVAGAVGMWPVAWAVQGTGDAVAPQLPVAALVALRLVAGFVGVAGFAVTFNTPPRVALATAGIGAVANTLRLTGVDLGVDAPVAAAAATLLVGLAAGALSRRLITPRITLTVPAVLVMIPGVAAYRAILATVTEQPLEALAQGMAGLTTVGALAAGLVVARMLTDPAWAGPAPVWTRPPRTAAQARVRADG